MPLPHASDVFKAFQEQSAKVFELLQQYAQLTQTLETQSNATGQHLADARRENSELLLQLNKMQEQLSAAQQELQRRPEAEEIETLNARIAELEADLQEHPAHVERLIAAKRSRIAAEMRKVEELERLR